MSLYQSHIKKNIYSFVYFHSTIICFHVHNRQNQISAMLANLRCIEVEIPGYPPPPNCAIIVQANPGTSTCYLLPSMHCKIVNMEDI